MQNGCEAPRHRLRSGVEGLGSRWRHFVWRLLNYGDGRHGWQSWVISLRVPAWSHFHNSSLPKISGHNVNTASSSASVASNRTSTASCFLQLLLLSIGSQYRGSVQKQLETANGVYFQENRTLKMFWSLTYLSIGSFWDSPSTCDCYSCPSIATTSLGACVPAAAQSLTHASPLQFNVYYVKKYTHLRHTWLHS